MWKLLVKTDLGWATIAEGTKREVEEFLRDYQESFPEEQLKMEKRDDTE